MREKSEVETIFKSFYQMVQTQFQEKIKIFRSDNGKEYFNKHLKKFFMETGIVHQSFVLTLLSKTEWLNEKINIC